MEAPTHKSCPRCGKAHPIEAGICSGCGRTFQTQAAPSAETPQDQRPVSPAIPSGYFPAPPGPEAFPSLKESPPPPAYPPQGYGQSAPPPPAYYSQPPPYGQLPPDYIWRPPGTHGMAAPILLSLFCLVGLAQMVNGQTAKGVCLLLSALVLGLLSYGILSIPIHIIGIVDAALIAGKLNQGRAVRPWEFF